MMMMISSKSDEEVRPRDTWVEWKDINANVGFVK